MEVIVMYSRHRGKDEQRSHLEQRAWRHQCPDQISFTFYLPDLDEGLPINGWYCYVCQGQRAFQRSLLPLSCSSSVCSRQRTVCAGSCKRFHTWSQLRSVPLLRSFSRSPFPLLTIGNKCRRRKDQYDKLGVPMEPPLD